MLFGNWKQLYMVISNWVLVDFHLTKSVASVTEHAHPTSFTVQSNNVLGAAVSCDVFCQPDLSAMDIQRSYNYPKVICPALDFCPIIYYVC